jgi:hypothetical protein
MAVLVAAFVVTLGFLVYVLLRPSEDALTNGLSISSDDPLAVAESHQRGDSPLIGDHWHAIYAIYIGGERQPNAPTWESGVHTHGDGIMHIHPFQGFEVGAGASVSKWFEYGGGELTETSMREPGMSTTFHSGDEVPGDDRPGDVFVFLGGSCDGGLDLVGQWIRVPVNYIPQDGDCLRIMFESEESMREHIKNPPSLPSPSPITETAPPSS